MKTTLSLILTAAIVLRAASACGSPAPQDAVKNIQPPTALSTALAKPEATPSAATAAAATTNAAAAAVSARAMSNDDVLALVDADLPAAVVVAKIRGARTAFDTRPETLAQLKSLGVPDEVLKAMIGEPLGAAVEQTPPAVLKDIKLPAGTRVELEMAHTIDSMTTRTGDAVSLRVVNPVVIDGATVIAQGATATARVVKAERNGHWGRAGRIVWELKEVTAVDGSRVALTASGRAVGDSKGAKVATQTVLLGLGLGVAAPAALLTGFKRGGNAVVPEGKRFDAVTRAEAVVNAPSRR
ncbi:MAG: hypothetical protein LC785_04925 [Acidobacteria bacterium]|nr:hypothetical protein [Acidobacteriota bacterium]MCA1641322.1 hypothetical protein [Acidobacteriota bacterium]